MFLVIGLDEISHHPIRYDAYPVANLSGFEHQLALFAGSENMRFCHKPEFFFRNVRPLGLVKFLKLSKFVIHGE
jgi:hypothetical protein